MSAGARCASPLAVTSASRFLPAAPVMQAGLRKITETFAAELAGRRSEEPSWSPLEWSLAKAVAALHGVSPLLCRTLAWEGGERWCEFLRDQRTHTVLRHARIVELLDRLDRCLRREGIAAVPLKGAALHTLGLYEAGDRPMADVDLLVDPRDAAAASRVIESHGYRKAGATWKEQVFVPLAAPAAAPLGEHSANGIKIELHDRIGELLPRRAAEISPLILPPRDRPGLNAYPSTAALMIHLLLHAAGSMGPKTLRLLNLHDIALLSVRMTSSDWNRLLAIRAEGLRLWWAGPPLFLMMRYYSTRVPEDVVEALRTDCPWLLHRLHRTRQVSDVSYSHLWVDAFPGIEWSRSPAEMMAYAIDRIRPPARTLEARKTLSATQAWARDPQWSALPQRRRLMRWLITRPARPATLQVVRSALGLTDE